MSHTLYPVKEIKEVINAEGVLNQPEATIRTLVFDSRKLTDMEHALFFALKGRRDGHEYLQEVYDQGIRNFVISEDSVMFKKYPDANILIVHDTLQAMQFLTAWHRKQFEYPVIAITGSNGKTIVKEWLYQLLAPEKN